MIIAFARQGQEIGQFAEDDVPALVASGQILPSDDYWHEGLDNWRKVGDRWPVAEVAHYPTTPVMTMEDVPTSSRSGFALVFWLIAVLLLAGGAYWYFNLRPAPGDPVATAQPSEEITEPSGTSATPTARSSSRLPLRWPADRGKLARSASLGHYRRLARHLAEEATLTTGSIDNHVFDNITTIQPDLHILRAYAVRRK